MGTSGNQLRVGVVGARRSRQGIGHHLARFALDAGAEVVGIVGTSPASTAEAGRALKALGATPHRHLDVRALLEADAPDVLFVASPHAAHGEALAAALEHGAHVLCEKPLCWGEDAAARAKDYAEAFQAAGRHLVVNAQWPYTLATWRTLYPGRLEQSPERFAMRLSPESRGEAMIPDALPHALSLLGAVVPPGDAHVEAPHVRVLARDASRIEVTFVYAAPGARVKATVDLRQGRGQPREAGYGFDGAYAARHVDMDGYRLTLEGGGRRIPLPDPTPQLVHAFLDRVSSCEPPTPDPNAWPGMAHLEAIHAAWARAENAFDEEGAGSR